MRQGDKRKDLARNTGRESISSSSEVTTYKRAVCTLDPNLEAKIE